MNVGIFTLRVWIISHRLWCLLQGFAQHLGYVVWGEKYILQRTLGISWRNILWDTVVNWCLLWANGISVAYGELVINLTTVWMLPKWEGGVPNRKVLDQQGLRPGGCKEPSGWRHTPVWFYLFYQQHTHEKTLFKYICNMWLQLQTVVRFLSTAPHRC